MGRALGIVAPIKMHKNVPSTMLGLSGDCAMPPRVGFRIEPSNAGEMIEGNATSVAEKNKRLNRGWICVAVMGQSFRVTGGDVFVKASTPGKMGNRNVVRVPVLCHIGNGFVRDVVIKVPIRMPISGRSKALVAFGGFRWSKNGPSEATATSARRQYHQRHTRILKSVPSRQLPYLIVGNTKVQGQKTPT